MESFLEAVLVVLSIMMSAYLLSSVGMRLTTRAMRRDVHVTISLKTPAGSEVVSQSVSFRSWGIAPEMTVPQAVSVGRVQQMVDEWRLGRELRTITSMTNGPAGFAMVDEAINGKLIVEYFQGRDMALRYVEFPQFTRALKKLGVSTKVKM